MENSNSTSDLLRFVGVIAVCVGFAWALQILGAGADGSALSRMMWVLGAAAIAGAGVGAILTGTSLRATEVPVRI